MAKNLYVGNLNYDTTESTLRALFEELGAIASINVIMDRMTGRSRGFAFVEMAEESAAQAAIAQLDGQLVDGRNIRVSEARPRRSRDDRGGGGRGGYGGGRGGYGGGRDRY
jgi:RNA recognition motif-containing protein